MQTLPTPPRLLAEAEAARYLGLSVHTLRLWRAGRGSHSTAPAFIRHGRTVRYDRADLDRWIESHRVKG